MDGRKTSPPSPPGPQCLLRLAGLEEEEEDEEEEDDEEEYMLQYIILSLRLILREHPLLFIQLQFPQRHKYIIN